MKFNEPFIDCIYEDDLYEQDMKEIRNKLVQRLPDKNICTLANVLMIETKYDIYAVKIRMCYTKEDGTIDIKKIHDWIRGLNFIKISREDYDELLNCEINFENWKEIKKTTEKLIPVGSNVIFKMDIDVDSLL